MENDVFNEDRMSIDDTKMFCALFYNNRAKLTKLIDELSTKHENDLFWWVLPIVTRNNMLSDFFKNTALCLLIKEKIDKGGIKEIIVKDKTVSDTLKAYIRTKNKPIVVHYTTQYKGVHLLRFIVKYIIFVSQQKRYARIKTEKIKNDIILVSTYLLSSMLQDGKLHDRYFGDMLKYTNRDNIYFAPEIILNDNKTYKEFVRQIESQREYRFVIKQKYLKCRDYLYILLFPVKALAFRQHRINYGELNLSYLFNNDLIISTRNNNAWVGILNYRFITRIRHTGINITSLIDWYEGQPSSVGLSFGFRRFYSESRSLAYILCPFAKDQLSVTPSKAQFINRIIPKTFGVIGNGYIPMVKEFCSELEAVSLPALRHQSVYIPLPTKSNTTKTVLVMLSYFLEESTHILKALEGLANTPVLKGVKILIKNHPVNQSLTSKEYQVDLTELDYEFVLGDAVTFIDSSNIVITAKTTSGLEILIRGIYAIFYELKGKYLKTYIPDDISPDLYRYAYNNHELENAIIALVNKKSNVDDVERIKRKYINKITTEQVEAIFKV